MRTSIILIAALFISQVAARAEEKGLDALKGKWKVTKADGRFEPKFLVFEGDKLSVVFSESEKKDAVVSVDAAQKPPHIDIGDKNRKSLGIYELNGDTLRLCFGEEGKSRPTEFKSGDGIFLVTLTREKK